MLMSVGDSSTTGAARAVPSPEVQHLGNAIALPTETKPAPALDPAESEKVTTVMVEALSKFIKIKAANLPETKPDSSFHFKQTLALFFLVANVTLSYLLVNAWLPKLVNAPIWHLLGQIAPIAVGSAYLLRGSGQLQSYLANKAAHTGFLILMAVIFCSVSTIAWFTQVPNLKIPIDHNSQIESVCVQPVRDLREAKLLAGLPEAKNNASGSPPADLGIRSCPDGELYFGSDADIGSFTLAQDYIITVKFDSGRQSFYLSRSAIWKRFLGSGTPLNFQLGTVNIPAASSEASQLLIIKKDPAALVYLPVYKNTKCFIHDTDPRMITCDLVKDVTGQLHLLPGLYSGKLGSDIIPDTPISNDQLPKILEPQRTRN
jgi:hypothetical protein